MVSPSLVDEALSKIMHVGTVDAMKWLAELVRADEREACAKVCEAAEESPQYFQTTSLPAAIRARGNT